MTNIDFSVAFVLLVISFVYAMTFVSSNISSEFERIGNNKLEESADYMTTTMFETEDPARLVSDFNLIQAKFTEEGGYPHQQELRIRISPSASGAKVYDRSFDLIPSTISNGDGTTISVPLTFSAYEKKYIYIVYSGGQITSIDYESNATESNVSFLSISERRIYALSAQRCSELRSMIYDSAKESFGFTENFRIDEGCEYGPQPPYDANLVVRSMPLLVESVNGTMENKIVRMTVW